MEDRIKPWEQGELRVAENGRYLVNGSAPFFWLGDTAWLLFHCLTREEIDLYLTNRAEKGFNVIQAVAVHRMPAKNVYGAEAFAEGSLKDSRDMTKPLTEGKDTYWDLVDYVFDRAEELGIYIGLLPHWGGIRKGGYITDDQAEAYAAFLAGRCGKRPNLIWITGGDTKGDKHEVYWKTLGGALKRLCPDKLVTFHPFGRTTSIDYFPDEDWLDFHMFQSGHRRYDQAKLNAWDDTSQTSYYYGEDSFRYVERVRNSPKPKPVLDGEPSYEHIPQGLHDPKEPFWTDADVRRYAYWSVFAGACGFTYGHSSIMQFFAGGPEHRTGAYGAFIPWKDALHSPGSAGMAHLARLMKSIPFPDGRPAQELLAGESGNAGEDIPVWWTEEHKYERTAAFAGEDFAVFYTYTGGDIRIRKGIFGGSRFRVWWFDPASGVMSYAGVKENSENARHNTSEADVFSAPQGDFGHTDWVLVLRKE